MNSFPHVKRPSGWHAKLHLKLKLKIKLHPHLHLWLPLAFKATPLGDLPPLTPHCTTNAQIDYKTHKCGLRRALHTLDAECKLS